MEYVTVILGIISSIVGLFTTGMVSAVNTLKKENAELKQKLADALAITAILDAETKASINEAVMRREQIIAGLKVELAALEDDRNACRDPAVIRERLVRLFAVP